MDQLSHRHTFNKTYLSVHRSVLPNPHHCNQFQYVSMFDVDHPSSSTRQLKLCPRPGQYSIFNEEQQNLFTTSTNIDQNQNIIKIEPNMCTTNPTIAGWTFETCNRKHALKHHFHYIGQVDIF